MQNFEGGYIALISVIIITFILFIAVFSLAQFGITSRFSLLDLENKSESEQLAAGCVQVAIIAIVNDPAYEAALVPVTVDDGECTIESVEVDTPSSGLSTIKTSAVVTGATTNLEVVWEQSGEDITSWEEVPNP